MLVRELIKQFKNEWLPVDTLQTFDKKAEASRELIMSGGDKKLLLAFDSMPLWKLRGLGPKRAMELWEIGVRPSNVTRHLKLLPDATRVALKYPPMDRIPHNMVTKIADAFIPRGEKGKCTIVGSYRRGKPFSGDVDILYEGCEDGDLAKFMTKIAEHLGHRWILMAQGPSKIAGIYRISPTKNVEVDIWVCSRDNHAAMLLYSTGSRDNNIRMRHIAKYRGLKLNQYGLWRGDKLIPTKTERDIYDKLEIKWQAPADR